ncbi:MAG: hypothetical protein NZ534_01235 [Bacteroidia bacterium]|nr:hypothetical protein [Bacteroidia bacterium]
MTSLEEFMHKVGQELNQNVRSLEGDVWMMDFPIVSSAGQSRHQYVYAQKEVRNGREVYLFTSRCGRYTPQTDLYKLLKENRRSIYAGLTITTDRLRTGQEVEIVAAFAATIAASADYDELRYLIQEVAELADEVERKYFGGQDRL